MDAALASRSPAVVIITNGLQLGSSLPRRHVESAPWVMSQGTALVYMLWAAECLMPPMPKAVKCSHGAFHMGGLPHTGLAECRLACSSGQGW